MRIVGHILIQLWRNKMNKETLLYKIMDLLDNRNKEAFFVPFEKAKAMVSEYIDEYVKEVLKAKETE